MYLRIMYIGKRRRIRLSFSPLHLCPAVAELDMRLSMVPFQEGNRVILNPWYKLPHDAMSEQSHVATIGVVTRLAISMTTVAPRRCCHSMTCQGLPIDRTCMHTGFGSRIGRRHIAVMFVRLVTSCGKRWYGA